MYPLRLDCPICRLQVCPPPVRLPDLNVVLVSIVVSIVFLAVIVVKVVVVVEVMV